MYLIRWYIPHYRHTTTMRHCVFASRRSEFFACDITMFFRLVGVNMNEITAAVNALTAAQIKAELSARDLSTKGKKDDW